MLLAIILVVILVRYAVPESSIEIENLTALYSDTDSAAGISDAVRPLNDMTSDFDPGTASSNTLKKAGLVSKEAKMLISYRAGIRSSGQEKQLLNINTSDSGAFIKLPGIGPVLSARIIRYRKLLGGYASVEQLREVYGLPEETFDIIRGRVYADSSEVIKTKVNSADFRQLCRIPYIERYEVSAILKFRELRGRIQDIGELVENKLVTAEKAVKMRPYLNFD